MQPTARSPETHKLGVAAQAWNPSTQEVEAEGTSEVQGHLLLHSKFEASPYLKRGRTGEVGANHGEM